MVPLTSVSPHPHQVERPEPPSNATREASHTESRLMRQRLFVLALASFCAVVLQTRVYDTFVRQRITVVRSPLASLDGRLGVYLPRRPDLGGAPAALILRLANNESTTQTLRIDLGNAVLAEVSIPPERHIRADLAVSDGAAVSQGVLTLNGPDAGWSLSSLEVANLHGFSSGWFEFVIVPNSARAAPFWGLGGTIAAWLILLGLPTSTLRTRRGRQLHMIFGSIMALFLTTVLVSPWVSTYTILLAPHTFVLCLAVLRYPTVQAIVKTVVRTMVPIALRVWRDVWKHRFPLLYAAAAGLFLTSVSQQYNPGTGLTSLIRFGDAFEQSVLPSVQAVQHRIAPESAGYDGQFYAQLAVDPLLLDPEIGTALDSPAYRARRILFSWTAYLLGLGQPQWVLHAYALQFIVAWLLLAWVLRHWLPPTDVRNLCLWFACMFSHGMIASVMNAVPDGPGMILLAFSILTLERGHQRCAAGLIGLGGLAKDINLLWVPVLAIPGFRNHRKWREWTIWSALITGPLLFWWIYVVGQFDFGNIAGGRNFSAPLTGYVEKLYFTLAELYRDGWSSYARFSLLTAISIATQALVLFTALAWHNAWWRVGVGSAVLMIFLGPAVWEGYPGAVTRVLLPMTFAFNIVLPKNRWFWPLFVLGNLLVIPAFETLRVPFWEYI